MFSPNSFLFRTDLKGIGSSRHVENFSTKLQCCYTIFSRILLKSWQIGVEGQPNYIRESTRSVIAVPGGIAAGSLRIWGRGIPRCPDAQADGRDCCTSACKPRLLLRLCLGLLELQLELSSSSSSSSLNVFFACFGESVNVKIGRTCFWKDTPLSWRHRESDIGRS